MLFMRTCLFVLLYFSHIVFLSADIKTGRLLVSIDSNAPFSSQEFSAASSATLVSIDSRNPYQALQKVFLDEPFVVLSHSLMEQDLGGGNSVLRQLAVRYGYRWVIFSEETLQEAVEKASTLLANVPRYTSDLPQLSEVEAKRLYNLLDKIDRVLSKNQVGYWAGRETLLGAIRHGGLIPWDDYLYLFMMDIDTKKLEASKKDFEDAGLVLHSYFKDFYKIYEKDALPLENCQSPGEILPFCYPAANLFVMTLEKRHEIEDTYVHRSFNFYFYWNHERFHYSQVENISRVPFGPLLIPIPSDPEACLDALFGTIQKPDLWKQYAIEFSWDHRRECRALHQGGALVEIDNFAPAPW